MRIERIELIGFKSFYEKTSFSFHPGVTAIVGPNGCGKSNIVDAFRWVLGEQSAKSLRGDSMEDVIFSGSASKKPKGMAEVTLVISGVNPGDDNGSPSESGEITVTRRLYRSGESEYLMNKIPCRLKDIKNVFLDTGLELKTYSILEQGKIDVILNSKPLERRFLIEEVAGVMKYNVRKAEALQKLESAQSNLQRLQDIITEVKRQINSVERYAKRAEKYKQIFEEIKSIDIKIAVRDAASLEKDLKSSAEIENTLVSKENELSTNIHSLDALIEKKKLLCTDKEKSLEETQKRLHSVERELIEEEGRISLLKSDCENLKDRLQRLLARDSELMSKKEDISIQIKNIEHKNAEMTLELSDIEKVLDSKNNTFSTLENEIVELEQKLEAERKLIFNKAEEISALKNEISNLSLMIENFDKKEKKSLEDIHSIKENISSLVASIKGTKDECHRLETGLKDRYEGKERLLDDINKKKDRLVIKEGGLYRDREDLAAMSSRAESLRELDLSRKSVVDKNVKILCYVADIFESLPEYETAIEAVLLDKLNVAVVNDHQEIKKALIFIREQNIHRSGFISANTPVQHSSSPGLDFSGNVIGKAIDFVKVRKGFDNIAALLLNDVIIVDNLNTALDLWQRSLTNSSRYFVTLNGEVLEPSGIVFGGTEKSILKIKREIKELEKQIENKRINVTSVEEEISALKNDIASIEDNLTSIDVEIVQMGKSHREMEMRIATLQEEHTRQQKQLEYLFIESEEDKKEKARMHHALSKRTEDCNISEDEKRSIEERMRKFQNELEAKKAELETLRPELTEMMVSRTAIKEKKDSFLRDSERLNYELLDIDRKREGMSRERCEIEENIKHKEDEIKEKVDSLRSLVVMINELKEESSKVKGILEAKTAEVNLIEKQQRINMEELTSLRKELGHIEAKKTELNLKLAHIKEDIKKTYYVVLDSIIKGQDLPELLPDEEEGLHDLREKLQGIGPVNLGTLEELAELKTRHNFLTKQQEDLLQSIKSLQETISRINNTTREKLTVAFDALNEKFKEVFGILFSKGRAELLLTEDNILEAGIDIVAQPPGKKLQNLMLLSGGETALTALSLLFAGFMIKPTPLCILDEVDAPLDEPNTDRFTPLLRQLSRNTQFIIITHNKRTMEIADYIYGITMEESGISKVVSMHMAEAV